jgi:putative thioredoxin
VGVSLSEHIHDVDESTFEGEVLLRSHDLPVIVDFWAPWCQPCRVLGPLLERLAIEAGGAFLLAKINVDDNPKLAVRYGVQGIPVVKAFRNGEVVSEMVGNQPEALVRRFLQKQAPSQLDRGLEEARSLLAVRRWSEAEQAYRQILEEQEGSSAAALGLVQSLLMQGRGGEAQAILRAFPPGDDGPAAERLRPLADLLAEVEEATPAAEDDPLAAELHQCARLIVRGNLPAAMDGLLDILRADKSYRKGLPRQVLLALFTLLGEQDPLARSYRDELASVLF